MKNRTNRANRTNRTNIENRTNGNIWKIEHIGQT